MLKKILFILNILIIISCKSQDKDKPINNLKMEIDLLSDFLKSEKYKEPNLKDFNNICYQYFNIDIDTLLEDYYQAIGQNNYGLSINKRFLNTFSESVFYNPNTLEDSYNLQQAETNLKNKNNFASKKFISYNKIIFNDDFSTISYFLQNQEDLLEIVLNFDYEKNKILYNSIFKSIITKNLDEEDTFHLLFYNNPQKGYKRKLINDLFIEKGIESIQELTDSYYNNWNKLKYKQEQKDQCLVHLINIFLQYEKNKNVTTIYEYMSYSYLSNFLKLDNKLSERLKLNNYYNNKNIKELVDNYFILESNENNSEIYNKQKLYKVEDSDGFTNLRKSNNAQSEIMKQLKNGELIKILNNENNWWLVETKEGKRGYVYYNRIKALD